MSEPEPSRRSLRPRPPWRRPVLPASAQRAPRHQAAQPPVSRWRLRRTDPRAATPASQRAPWLWLVIVAVAIVVVLAVATALLVGLLLRPS